MGAVLASRNAKILEITLKNMLKFCDWLLVVLDNEDREVTEMVNFYNERNYSKMWIRRSCAPHQVIGRFGELLDYRGRWRALKGWIRDDVFINLRRIVNSDPSYKIDILIFYDSDEIFTDHLPELLHKFQQSDKRAISMKAVDVVNDLFTLRSEHKGHHVYIMKYDQALAGLPRRFYALYYPLERKDLMFAENYSVHLAYLTPENREWRSNNWKKHELDGCNLWRLNKSVLEMRPEEITNVFKKEPDAKFS